MVATAVVVTALGILAALSAVALQTIMSARDRSLAVIHAHTKFEELYAQRTPLAVSPSDALDRDVAGWSEYLDASGRVHGVDALARGTVFVRRWRVDAAAGQAELRTIAVRVGRCVTDRASAGGCDMAANAVLVSGLRSEVVW